MKPHAQKPSRRNQANAAARAERKAEGPPAKSKYARKREAQLKAEDPKARGPR